MCLPVSTEAGKFMSKTGSPKMNLHERERVRKREEEEKSIYIRGERGGGGLRFNGLRTAQFPNSHRWDPGVLLKIKNAYLD